MPLASGMAAPLPMPLVDVAWLAAHRADPALVLLDASWYLPAMARDARAEFRAGHLPGARFFDLDAASDHASPLPHMLPDDAALARVLQQHGVTPDSRVVIYDGSGANLSAGRVWWMLRVAGHAAVAVLDGGLAAWRAAGLPLETGDPAPAAAATPYPVRRQAALVRTADAVAATLAAGGQVADARPAARFTGDAPEPRPGLRAGHMPGARSLPFTTLVGPDGKLLNAEALAARFADAGLDPARPITCTCGSGTSAGAIALAIAVLGRDDAAIYDGAWSEWGADPARPVATGPA